MAAAVAFHNEQAPETEEDLTVHQVSSTLGIALPVVQRLARDLTVEVLTRNATVTDWRVWLFDWIEANADLFDQIFRPTTINELFDGEFAAKEESKDRAELALPTLRTLTRLWMRAEPLNALQLALGTAPDKLKACVDARRFALRVVPELAYLFGLPAFLLQRKASVEGDQQNELPAALAKLGSCIRHGYRSVEYAALAFYLRSEKLSRRQVHEQFALLKPHLKGAKAPETWDVTVSRVEMAIMAEINGRADFPL